MVETDPQNTSVLFDIYDYHHRGNVRCFPIAILAKRTDNLGRIYLRDACHCQWIVQRGHGLGIQVCSGYVCTTNAFSYFDTEFNNMLSKDTFLLRLRRLPNM